MKHNRIGYQCEECGGWAEQTPSIYNRAEHHYCSPSCAVSGKNRRWRGPRPHLQDRIVVNCAICGSSFETYRAWAKKVKRQTCSPACYGRLRSMLTTGEASPVWKGGRSVNKGGYIIEHRADGRHELVHRMVMEKHLGRKLTSDDVVHHVNGIRTDNRIENLEVMTNSEHATLHQSTRDL